MAFIGYARASTVEQDLELQFEALNEAWLLKMIEKPSL
jgi:DNA invertase Pin-like site-specific DNA recombinase